MKSSYSLETAHALQPRSWIRPHYSSFDGLRGMAVAMVFACHYGIFLNLSKVVNVTWTGVDVFFVLSGFLITGILFDSLSAPHYFRDFYTRRALRIFPVFYGFFLALFLLTPVLHLYYHLNILAFVFYIGNLTLPFTDLNLHNPTMLWIRHRGGLLYWGNLGPLWSLCVEEQFYLVWPAVVWWVRDRRRLMNICAVMAVLTLAGRLCLYRYAKVDVIERYLLQWSTYTRCDTLLMGAWLALYLRGQTLTRAQLRNFAAALLLVAVTGLAFGLHHWYSPRFFFNRFLMTAGFTLVGLAAMGVLLLALDDENLFSRLLRNRLLQRLGVISYGVYFYHELPIGLWEHVAGAHPQLAWAVPVLALLLTLTVASLSFRYLETPFLRLKKVLAPRAATEGARPGNIPDGIPDAPRVAENR
jgi:peptidoglycan/LPS O-acetylase OafA/YrhL